MTSVSIPAHPPCFACRRLDYFVVSERLVKDVTDCVIRKDVLGSDHCPLILGLSTPSVGDTSNEVDSTPGEDTSKETPREDTIKADTSKEMDSTPRVD